MDVSYMCSWNVWQLFWQILIEITLWGEDQETEEDTLKIKLKKQVEQIQRKNQAIETSLSKITVLKIGSNILRQSMIVSKKTLTKDQRQTNQHVKDYQLKQDK